MSRNNQRRINPANRQKQHQRVLVRLGHTTLVLAVMVGFTAGTWWLNQALSVSQWVVAAPAPLKEMIEARLDTMPARDFLHTRPGLLREQWLATMPDVEDMQIVRRLPHSLTVHAVARTPVAVWQDERNHLHLFDHHGQTYRLLARGEATDLPLLRVKEGQLPAVHLLLQALAEQQVHPSSELSEVHADGDHWKLYFSQGAVWLLPKKLERETIHAMAEILTQPRWQQGIWSMDTRIQSRWFIRPAGHGGVI